MNWEKKDDLDYSAPLPIEQLRRLKTRLRVFSLPLEKT
jgi:hypothetical protein